MSNISSEYHPRLLSVVPVDLVKLLAEIEAETEAAEASDQSQEKN